MQEGSDDAPVERLPRGPHGLSTEQVRASQRARLTRAMLDLVGEQGWADTTVPQVVAAAKVSKNAFYELFSDKVDCYLAAMDDEVTELLRAIGAATAPAWRETLQLGMDVYVRWWQQRPLAARAYLVELPEAGARAVAQRERAYEALERVFAALARQIAAEQPAAAAPRPVALRAVVSSITDAVALEVREGRLDQLHERTADLQWLVIRLLGDDAALADFEAAQA